LVAWFYLTPMVCAQCVPVVAELAVCRSHTLSVSLTHTSAAAQCPSSAHRADTVCSRVCTSTCTTPLSPPSLPTTACTTYVAHAPTVCTPRRALRARHTTAASPIPLLACARTRRAASLAAAVSASRLTRPGRTSAYSQRQATSPPRSGFGCRTSRGRRTRRCPRRRPGPRATR